MFSRSVIAYVSNARLFRNCSRVIKKMLIVLFFARYRYHLLYADLRIARYWYGVLVSCACFAWNMATPYDRKKRHTDDDGWKV